MDFYNHYLEAKQKNRDALVFYRVGDFYELFGRDAETASEELGLTLTSRDCGLAERVPMCGVPAHALDGYTAKLIKKWHKVAVCESVPPAEIKQATKPDGRLNLKAETAEQKILKTYLEENTNEALAEKINNGVKIEKDGKTLINRKTLETFMDYACKEAQTQAEKGAKFACLGQDVIFGWAIHYFEESDIEGTLYNEDGTEYKPPKPVRKTDDSRVKALPITPLKPKPQISLFDMLGNGAGKPVEVKPIEPETAAPETLLPIEPDEPDESENDVAINEPGGEDIPHNEPTAELPSKPEAPRDLIRISETGYVDGDGVVYDIPPSEAKPVETGGVIPGALKEILGNMLVAR